MSAKVTNGEMVTGLISVAVWLDIDPQFCNSSRSIVLRDVSFQNNILLMSTVEDNIVGGVPDCSVPGSLRQRDLTKTITEKKGTPPMVKLFSAIVLLMLVVSGCTTAPETSKSDVAIVTPTPAPAPASISPVANNNTGFVSAGNDAVVESAGGCVRSGSWSDSLGNCGESAVQEVLPTPAVAEVPAVSESSEPKEPVLVRETLNGSALFAVNSSELSAEGFQALEDLVDRIGDVAGAGRIEIVGHTDDTGPEAYNQKLSAERAQHVQDFLEDKISGLSITSSAQGELSPIADNSTEEGRAKNRRVEVLVSRSRIAE